MNNRFAQGSKAMPEEIRKLFDRLTIMSGGNLGVNYDIRPTNDALAVIPRDDSPEIHAMRFGLWEPWMKGKKSYATFNARWETLEGSRLYGPLWRKRQRVAVPATGWYEWDGPKGNKRRWHFSTGEPDGFFWFGGVFNKYTDEHGDEARSFSLITVPANAVVGEHHSTPKDPGGRMPVILEHEDLTRWLDPDEEASDMIESWPDERTDCYEVPRQEVGIAQALPLR